MGGTDRDETLESTSLPTIPIKCYWEIQYARFFGYPRLPSTSPFLRPLPTVKRVPSNGNWLSSRRASLHLLAQHSSAELVVVVAVQENIHEEHFISMLHFSWPQVSCFHECPVRGSRVVLASYSDCVGQIQKFAMRFSTDSESQSFMDSVKATMKSERNSCELGKSSQFEFIRSNGILYSGAEDTKPPLSCVGLQDAYSEDHGFEGNCTIIPPDITTLMAATCTAPKIETPEEVLPEVQHVVSSENLNSLIFFIDLPAK